MFTDFERVVLTDLRRIADYLERIANQLELDAEERRKRDESVIFTWDGSPLGEEKHE